MHDHHGDDELLGTLKQLGVDLAKPREINFYFIFPSEADASAACSRLVQQKLEAEKFQATVPWWKRLFAKPDWLVAATGHMPLNETEIKKLTTLFQQLAAQCHGRYDGWEANVMGDDIDVDRLNQLRE
jgi:hypothetical protein